MNAVRFFEEYVEQVRPDRIMHEVYKNGPLLTKVVNEKLIPDIIQKIWGKTDENEVWKVQNEYFRIDVVGWQSKGASVAKEAKKHGLNPHLWNLKIAVEHENSPGDWTDEVIKLIHVKCPLKVVIGYNYCDRRDDNDESDIEKLKCVAGWMQQVDAFKMSEEEEYLVILGNAKGKELYTEFDYRGYVYDYQKRGFVRLTGQEARG